MCLPSREKVLGKGYVHMQMREVHSCADAQRAAEAARAAKQRADEEAAAKAAAEAAAAQKVGCTLEAKPVRLACSGTCPRCR